MAVVLRFSTSLYDDNLAQDVGGVDKLLHQHTSDTDHLLLTRAKNVEVRENKRGGEPCLEGRFENTQNYQKSIYPPRVQVAQGGRVRTSGRYALKI